MSTRVSWLAALLLVVAIPLQVGAGPGETGTKPGSDKDMPAPAEIGKPAPQFALKDVDGTDVQLSDFKGKIVVLEWINHECPVVNRCHGANTMAHTFAKFKNEPVVWLAIDSSHFCQEKVDTIKEWIQQKKVDYPYLLDASGKVGQMFGAKTTPHMFVIDKNGVLAYSGAIDNNPNGKEDNVTNYVEEAVSSLLNGSAVATSTTKSYGCSVKYKK